MLAEYYLTTYKNYSSTELIEEFNTIDGKLENLSRLLIISTFLVHRLSYLQRELISNLELLTSISIELVQNKISNKKFVLTLNKVTTSLNSEVNPFNVMLFQGINNYFPPEFHEPTSLENLIVKTFKLELLHDCPDSLRLALVNYLNTGNLYINNYSDVDRYVLKLLLLEAGIPMESEITLDNYNKIKTTVEKSVFLYFLYTNFPDVFVLLTSTKDINKLFLLVECNKLLKNLANNIIPALEDCALKTLKFLAETDVNQYKNKFFTKVANAIEFDINNTKLCDLMSDAVSDTYSKFEELVKATYDRCKSTGEMTPFISILNSESNQSANLLMKLNKK